MKSLLKNDWRGWTIALSLLGLSAGALTMRAREWRAADAVDEQLVRRSIEMEKNFHTRPIEHRDGRTYIAAGWDPSRGVETWFDVTGSPIDPERFQYGIGKDRIPSIDRPRYAAAADPALAERGIGPETVVIGYADGDDARAYPIAALNRHELVNDTIGGKPVTVGW